MDKTQGARCQGGLGGEQAIEKLGAVNEEIYRFQGPAEGKTTFNVGTISGGTSVNTIAQEARMLCEFRSDNKAGLDYMKEQFDRILDRPELTVELVGERPCENLSPEAEEKREALLQKAEARLKAATGREETRQPGPTDRHIPPSVGLPALALGHLVATEHATPPPTPLRL